MSPVHPARHLISGMPPSCAQQLHSSYLAASRAGAWALLPPHCPPLTRLLPCAPSAMQINAKLKITPVDKDDHTFKAYLTRTKNFLIRGVVQASGGLTWRAPRPGARPTPRPDPVPRRPQRSRLPSSWLTCQLASGVGAPRACHGPAGGCLVGDAAAGGSLASVQHDRPAATREHYWALRSPAHCPRAWRACRTCTWTSRRTSSCRICTRPPSASTPALRRCSSTCWWGRRRCCAGLMIWAANMRGMRSTSGDPPAACHRRLLTVHCADLAAGHVCLRHVLLPRCQRCG